MTTIEEQLSSAATAAERTSPAAPTRRQRLLPATLLSLRVITTIHAVTIFAQPVFAGSYLTGDYDMLARHASGADVVTSFGYLQLVLAIVLWILGGPRWPTVATAVLVVAETGQYFAGLAGALDLHVPLGVALMSGAVLITFALWRPQGREPRGGVR